ncbi:unnamed protein product [Amoebophrya sp. A120]|nr:unnamed protein product [Amoebophrya sp. A120]|eukprot:GSA120T00009338001.1
MAMVLIVLVALRVFTSIFQSCRPTTVVFVHAQSDVELSSFMVEGSALDTEGLGVTLTKEATRELDGIRQGFWPGTNETEIYHGPIEQKVRPAGAGTARRPARSTTGSTSSRIICSSSGSTSTNTKGTRSAEVDDVGTNPSPAPSTTKNFIAVNPATSVFFQQYNETSSSTTASWCGSRTAADHAMIERLLRLDEGEELVNPEITYFPGIEEQLQELPPARSVAPEPSDAILFDGVWQLWDSLGTTRLQELYMKVLHTVGGHKNLKLVRKMEEKLKQYDVLARTNKTSDAKTGVGATEWPSTSSGVVETASALSTREGQNYPAGQKAAPETVVSGGQSSTQKISAATASQQVQANMVAAFEKRKAQPLPLPQKYERKARSSSRSPYSFHDCIQQTNCHVRNLCLSPNGKQFIYTKNKHSIYYDLIHKTTSRRSEGVIYPYTQMDFKRFRKSPRAFRFLFQNPWKQVHPYWPESRILELMGMSISPRSNEMFAPLREMQVWQGTEDKDSKRSSSHLPYPYVSSSTPEQAEKTETRGTSTNEAVLKSHQKEVHIVIGKPPPDDVLVSNLSAFTTRKHTLQTALDVAWQIFVALSRWGFLKADYQKVGDKMRRAFSANERTPTGTTRPATADTASSPSSVAVKTVKDEIQKILRAHPKVHVYLVDEMDHTVADEFFTKRKKKRTNARPGHVLRMQKRNSTIRSPPFGSNGGELHTNSGGTDSSATTQAAASSSPAVHASKFVPIMQKNKKPRDQSNFLEEVLLATIASTVTPFREMPRGRCFQHVILGWRHWPWFDPDLVWKYEQNTILKHKTGNGVDPVMLDGFRNYLFLRLGIDGKELIRNARAVEIVREEINGASTSAEALELPKAQKKGKRPVIAIEKIDKRKPKVIIFRNHRRAVRAVSPILVAAAASRTQSTPGEQDLISSGGQRPQSGKNYNKDFAATIGDLSNAEEVAEYLQKRFTKTGLSSSAGHDVPVLPPVAPFDIEILDPMQMLEETESLSGREYLLQTVTKSLQTDIFIGYDPLAPADFLFSPRYAGLIAPWLTGEDRTERVFQFDRLYKQLPHRLITHYGVAVTGRQGRALSSFLSASCREAIGLLGGGGGGAAQEEMTPEAVGATTTGGGSTSGGQTTSKGSSKQSSEARKHAELIADMIETGGAYGSRPTTSFTAPRNDHGEDHLDDDQQRLSEAIAQSCGTTTSGSTFAPQQTLQRTSQHSLQNSQQQLSSLVLHPSRKELGGLKGVILGHPYPFNITETEQFRLSGLPELGDYFAEAVDFLRINNRVRFSRSEFEQIFKQEVDKPRVKNRVFKRPKQSPHQLAYLARIFNGKGDFERVVEDVINFHKGKK